MDLLQLNYNCSRYILLLKLGEKENRICGLDSASLDKSTIETLKLNIKEIQKLDLWGKINWIKQNAPEAYGAYKEISLSKIKIENTIRIE